MFANTLPHRLAPKPSPSPAPRFLFSALARRASASRASAASAARSARALAAAALAAVPGPGNLGNRSSPGDATGTDGRRPESEGARAARWDPDVGLRMVTLAPDPPSPTRASEKTVLSTVPGAANGLDAEADDDAGGFEGDDGSSGLSSASPFSSPPPLSSPVVRVVRVVRVWESSRVLDSLLGGSHGLLGAAPTWGRCAVSASATSAKHARFSARYTRTSSSILASTSGRCSVRLTPPVGGLSLTCIVCGLNRAMRLATCASCSSTSNARFTTCPSQNTSPLSPLAPTSPAPAAATSPHPSESSTSICCPGSARSRPSFSNSELGLLYPLSAPSTNT